MDFISRPIVWQVTAVLFGVGCAGLGYLYYLLFNRTNVKMQLKAHLSKTPVNIFFQDNKFCESKMITPINAMVYDKFYGPYVVSSTYVDKKTKNIVIPFDVDLDSGRVVDYPSLVSDLKQFTKDEKKIASLRKKIISEEGSFFKHQPYLESRITVGSLKKLLSNSVVHKIRSRIEKLVAVRMANQTAVDFKPAVIIFIAIFGAIVLASIVLSNFGG